MGQRPALVAVLLLVSSPNAWGHGLVAYPYAFLALFSAAVAWASIETRWGRHNLSLAGALLLGIGSGFRPDLRQLLPDVDGVLDKHGMPLLTGRATRKPGLYFCGQITAATGQFREVGLEAQRIAVLAKAHLRQ